MATFLRHQGFRTYRAQIHVNVGLHPPGRRPARATARVDRDRRDRKVTIVGHSLGGMLARGLAARRPDLVEGIVTMGSPVLAPGAVHRVLAWDAADAGPADPGRLPRADERGLLGGECARLSLEESSCRSTPTSRSPRSTASATASSTGGPASTRRPSRRGAHQPLRHGRGPGRDGPRARRRCASSRSGGPAGGRSWRRGGFAPRRSHVIAATSIAPPSSRSSAVASSGSPARAAERAEVGELGQRRRP